MSITITDTTGTSGTVTVNDASDVTAAIRPWFDDAPTEILDAINDLADELYTRHPYTAHLEALLGIDVTRD